ncbi:hypothetical protein Tco_0762557, partial [Tanacetum coccineum]
NFFDIDERGLNRCVQTSFFAFLIEAWTDVFKRHSDIEERGLNCFGQTSF